MKNPKIISFVFCLLSFVFCLLTGCGGSGGPANLTGPDLSISELVSIKIDQLKFTGGLDDDQDGTPEPAIYIRCADSEVDIACAGADQGLDIVTKSGTVYGRIDAIFEPVENVKETNCFDVNLVFVEKDSDGCPAPISDDDDELWVSGPLSLNELGTGSLLKNPVESDDGLFMAYLISSADQPEEDIAFNPVPQTDNILKVDQLYIKSATINDDTSFKLVVKSATGENFRCEASFDAATTGITKMDIIYGNLGILLKDNDLSDCLITEENKMEDINITLYISDNNAVVTSLNTTSLVDLVDNDGGKEDLQNGGFVRFLMVDGIE